MTYYPSETLHIRKVFLSQSSTYDQENKQSETSDVHDEEVYTQYIDHPISTVTVTMLAAISRKIGNHI